MVHMVKEPFDIHVHNPSVSVAHRLVHNLERTVTAQSGTKPVTRLLELRFEDRGQYLQQRLLHDAVPYRRYPQRSLATVRFRDVHPAYRRWPVRLGAQITRQGLQAFR